MEAKKFYTLEEIEDKYIGEKVRGFIWIQY